MTINTLPDFVLLQIFHFDRVKHFDEVGDGDSDRLCFPWRWDRLVHVCWRWRSIVFASPKFLDLRLVCVSNTRLELLGIWPPLPIIITDIYLPIFDFNTAIEHHSRVCEIHLFRLTTLQLRRLVSAMQEKFLPLIHLALSSVGTASPVPALPDGFLGGSASLLQSLELRWIPFPALPKLLLSATNLVHLSLEGSPDSGYIQPQVIVTSLAAMANLKSLAIGFALPQSFFDQESQSPPPPTCNILYALTCFKFKGVSEYLEDLVARIDAPLLDFIQIVLFDRPAFNFPQLTRFMRRATKFEAPNEVCVYFIPDGFQVKSLPPRGGSHEEYRLEIIFKMLIWEHLPLAAKVFASFLPSICMVHHLYIFCTPYLVSKFNATLMQWLEIFCPFIAVKHFYICQELAQWIVLWEQSTDVLPALETLFLNELQPSGRTQEAIEQFVATRRLLGHPVAVSLWDGTGGRLQEH